MLKKSHSCLGNRGTFTSGAQGTALALIACAAVVSSSARAQNLSNAHRTPCGANAEITFSLGSDWEDVDSKRFGVLCAFRTKNKGFPTLTVVKTPPTPPYDRRSAESLRAFLERSYRSVGISDAKVMELDSAVIAGTEASEAVMTFTAAGAQMKALVVSIELPDRAYILTLQGSADVFDSEKNRLKSVAQSAQIAALPLEIPRQGEALGSRTKGWLRNVLTLLLSIGGVLAVTYIWRRRLKRLP